MNPGSTSPWPPSDSLTKQQKVRDDAPDLATQLEDLLHAVWAAEADWRLDDRLDLAARLQARSKAS